MITTKINRAMKDQNEKLELIKENSETTKREVMPVSNYVFLHWWHNFDWELYVKILKAKELL
jgi:hypothetical protein